MNAQNDLLEEVSARTERLRAEAAAAARTLRDYTRRLELILSQDHKKISVRDEAFAADFAAFCTDLRKNVDAHMDYWQCAREALRARPVTGEYADALGAKGFFSRAKTLSRASDELTSAYDAFGRFYKNYTLARLPVWLLTCCCDDVGNLTGKILFLSRELVKKTEKERG